MTRYAKVGEGRKRPLDATQWKDMKKKDNKKLKRAQEKGGQHSTIVQSSASENYGIEKKAKPFSFDKTNSKNDQIESRPATIESKPVEKNDSVEDINEKQEQGSDKQTSLNKFEKKPVDKQNMSGGKKFVKKDYSKMECYNCHKKGHKISDCPEQRVFECYNCHKKGHKASECPEPSDGKMDNVECFKCHQKGHKSFKCPNIDKVAAKKTKFENTYKDKAKDKKQDDGDPSIDFASFKKDFEKQLQKQTGFKKELLGAWKAQEKGSEKTFNQFKKEFKQGWLKKTGFSKALREEWKKHGLELKQELRKKERSEQRRQARIEKRESELVGAVTAV